MFFARALVALFCFFSVAFAAPNDKRGGGPTKTVTVTATPTATSISQCNNGGAQCCNQVTQASNPAAGVILGLLNIVLSDVNVLVGLGCTPISVIGVGSGNTCNEQAVCCENNNFNGLINIGCSPITL